MKQNKEERKFNIGDRVICIDKSYYGNIYHNGLSNKDDNHFIRSSIVSDVYGYKSSPNKVFYVDNYHHQVDSCGDSCNYQYGEISEKDGTYTSMRSSNKVWYHAEKDADEIKRVIEECKKDFHKECEESRQREIDKLESEIRYAQKRIYELKKGDKFLHCGWTKSEKEWNDKMDEIIGKKIKK